MTMKKLLATCAICFSALLSVAQTQDLGMWATLSVNKDIGEKFQLGFDQELRLRDNLSTLNLVYTNIGASYKVNDFFKIGLVYRFIDKHKDDFTWGQRHRLYTDFTFKLKPGKFNVSARLRLQAEWRGHGYESVFGNVPEVYVRNQYKVGYKLTDKIEPYLGTELRWQVQNPRIAYHDGFDRTRLFGGANFQLNKKNIVGVFFLYQREWNTSDPETLYIIGLEYTLNL